MAYLDATELRALAETAEALVKGRGRLST